MTDYHVGPVLATRVDSSPPWPRPGVRGLRRPLLRRRMLLSGARRLSGAAGALAWTVLAAAHLRIVPGKWRMDAHTPAGALHYSACLQARHFAAQIMSHEGQHCRLVGPVVVHGAVLTVREDCRVSHFSGQHGVRVHLTARVRVQAGGHQFTGQSHTVITTPLGNITEHQKITGVWVAPCRAP